MCLNKYTYIQIYIFIYSPPVRLGLLDFKSRPVLTPHPPPSSSDDPSDDSSDGLLYTRQPTPGNPQVSRVMG